jgi:hypothetical protein
VSQAPKETAPNSLEEKEIPFAKRDLVQVSLSIKIPEVLEYLECADVEDWLTAAFFENADRMPLWHLCFHGDYRSEIRSVDVWIVEFTQRTRKIWSGKVQVEITEVRSGGSKAGLSRGHRYAELFFAFERGNQNRSCE